MNCLNSFSTKNKLESYKRVSEKRDFFSVIGSSEGTKILEFNQYQKFNKAPFIIYADFEFIIQKINGFKNNPDIWSTTKVSEPNPSDFSMATISPFRSIGNNHNVYRI